MPDTPSAERYVAGTLSEEEIARFEETMIERPDLAADVNVRQRIRAGLELLEQRQQLQPFLAPAVSRGYSRMAAAAAVLCVAISGTWLGLRQFDDRPAVMLTDAQTRDAPIAGPFTLALTRSRTEPPPIVKPAQGLIHIQLLVSEAATFDVALRRSGDHTETIGSRVRAASQDEFVHVFLDAAQLGDGAFEIELTAADGTSRSFPFKLIRAPE